MVVVLGPKGGAGKTLVSSSLAITMAESGKDVVLLDLDLQFGDAALTLGLPPTRTIYDLVNSGGSLDAEKLADYLVTHESGVKVLGAGAPRPGRQRHRRLPSPAVRRTPGDRRLDRGGQLARLHTRGDRGDRRVHRHLHGRDCGRRAALKNTKLGLETLERMGVPAEKVKLVLNRADSRIGITPEDVHAVTGRPADGLIPSHRDVARASSEARPIVTSQPASQPAKALRSLADSYLGTREQASGARSCDCWGGR